MNAPEFDAMIAAWHEMRAARKDLDEHGGKERLDYMRTAARDYAVKQRAWSAAIVREGMAWRRPVKRTEGKASA